MNEERKDLAPMNKYLEKRISDLSDQLKFFLPRLIKSDIQNRITELEKALTHFNQLNQ